MSNLSLISFSLEPLFIVQSAHALIKSPFPAATGSSHKDKAVRNVEEKNIKSYYFQINSRHNFPMQPHDFLEPPRCIHHSLFNFMLCCSDEGFPLQTWMSLSQRERPQSREII